MSVTTHPSARAEALPLALTLLARAVTHAAFLIWVLAADPAWFDVFWVGGAYGLADGTLGLVTALLLARRTPIAAPPLLVGMVLADGVMRLAAGIALRAFPGIPDIPIAVVLYFGALGSWAAVAGAIAVGGWLFAHTRHDRAGSGRARVLALFDPLSAAGLVALGLALYAVIMGPPASTRELHMYAAVACAGLSCVFAAAAAGALRSPLLEVEAER